MPPQSALSPAIETSVSCSSSPFERDLAVPQPISRARLWQDKLFNAAVITLPSVLILPVFIWTLERLGLLTIPRGSNLALFMTAVHYVVLTVSSVFVAAFLLLALTTRKKTSGLGSDLTFEEMDFEVSEPQAAELASRTPSHLAFEQTIQPSASSSIFVVMSRGRVATRSPELEQCPVAGSPIVESEATMDDESAETEGGLGGLKADLGAVDERPPSYEDAVAARLP